MGMGRREEGWGGGLWAITITITDWSRYCITYHLITIITIAITDDYDTDLWWRGWEKVEREKGTLTITTTT